ncbi:hypothetical protein MIR68_005467 [Amoeboaphelidium protococcarum]|nr:hypothetical protein MIR68_005467 [Amoeboaphelidium protococcarum]
MMEEDGVKTTKTRKNRKILSRYYSNVMSQRQISKANQTKLMNQLHKSLRVDLESNHKTLDNFQQDLQSLGSDFSSHLCHSTEIGSKLSQLDALRDHLKGVREQQRAVKECLDKCSILNAEAANSYDGLHGLLLLNVKDSDEQQLPPNSSPHIQHRALNGRISVSSGRPFSCVSTSDMVSLDSHCLDSTGASADFCNRLNDELISSAVDDQQSHHDDGGRSDNSLDSGVVLHLLNVVSDFQGHLARSLLSLSGQGFDGPLLGKLTDLIKGPLRESRYKCEQQQSQMVDLQNQMLKLSAQLVHDDKQREFEAATKDQTAIGDRLVNSLAGIRFRNSKNDAKDDSGHNSSTLSSFDQAVASSEKLTALNDQTDAALLAVQNALYNEQLPLILLDHLRELKRFFTLGLDTLNQVCPDDQLDLMKKVLKKRRSLNSISAKKDSVVNGHQTISGSVRRQSQASVDAKNSQLQMLQQQSVNSIGYESVKLNYAPKPPPLPSKPATLGPSSGFVKAQAPQQKQFIVPPPSAPPRFVPPSPPQSDPPSKMNEVNLTAVEIEGLSLEDASIVRLMSSLDIDLIQYLCIQSSNGNQLSPASVKHLNSSLKIMDELKMLDLFIVQFLNKYLHLVFKRESVKCPALTEESGFMQLDGDASGLPLVVLKQYFVVTCRHYCQKVISLSLTEIQNYLNSSQSFDLDVLVEKIVRIIIQNKGLLPKSVRFIVEQFIKEQGCESGDGCYVVESFIIQRLIAPLFEDPVQFGVSGLPWDQSWQVHQLYCAMHRDSLRMSSPASRVISRAGSVAFDQQDQYTELKDAFVQLAQALRHIGKLYVHVNVDHPAELEGDASKCYVIASKVYSKMGTQIEDFMDYFKATQSIHISAPSPQMSFADSMSMMLLTQELDILKDDYLLGSQWHSFLKSLLSKYSQDTAKVVQYSAAHYLESKCSEKVKTPPAMFEESFGNGANGGDMQTWNQNAKTLTVPVTPRMHGKKLTEVRSNLLKKVERWSQVSKSKSHSSLAPDSDSDSD